MDGKSLETETNADSDNVSFDLRFPGCWMDEGVQVVTFGGMRCKIFEAGDWCRCWRELELL